jgi:hypothetical protein
MSGHVRGLQRRTLLVDLGFRTHHDSGNAKTALKSAARGESRGEPLALVLCETFESRDFCSGDLRQWLLATDDCLAIDEDSAAAALSGG